MTAKSAIMVLDKADGKVVQPTSFTYVVDN